MARWFLCGARLLFRISSLVAELENRPGAVGAVSCTWLGRIVLEKERRARFALARSFRSDMAVRRLIETPDGRVILYDCGRIGSPILGERAVEAVLRSRGIRRIDALVISHADTDHYNSAPELMRRFRVSQIITSTSMFDNAARSPAAQTLQKSMEDQNVHWTTVRRSGIIS